MTSLRFSRRLFFLCLMLLSGCISIPAELKTQVSADGAHATAAGSMGPITVLQTASYLPGQKGYRAGKLQVERCSSPISAVEIAWPDAVALRAPEAADVCRSINTAVDYVSAFSKHKPFLKYRIELLSTGTTFTRRSVSWYPAGPRLVLAFAWTSTEDSLASIIDTVAHEALHMLAGIDRLPPSRRHSEPEAYLAGACAQLAATGRLRLSDLTINRLTPGLGVVEAAVESSNAGFHLSESLAQYFDNGLVADGTAGGERLQRACRETLTAFFSN